MRLKPPCELRFDFAEELFFFIAKAAVYVLTGFCRGGQLGQMDIIFICHASLYTSLHASSLVPFFLSLPLILFYNIVHKMVL